MIRLDKYLCEMEAGTRSEVKVFIKKGRVTVNGETAKSPEQNKEILEKGPLDLTSGKIKPGGLEPVAQIGDSHRRLRL